MSYAELLLEQVLNFARENMAKEVKEVEVEIGELLLLNQKQLEFCFSVIARDTIAESARLKILTSKAKRICAGCGMELNSDGVFCKCGGEVRIEGGKDFILRKIIIEV